VRVDQTRAVGTVIKTGDYVDTLIALTEEQFASVVEDPCNRQVIVTNPGTRARPSSSSSRACGAGRSLPPCASSGDGRGSSRGIRAPGTVLNEQQEIVISRSRPSRPSDPIRPADGQPAADAVARPSLA
jgi:hypothetical protein